MHLKIQMSYLEVFEAFSIRRKKERRDINKEKNIWNSFLMKVFNTKLRKKNKIF